MARFDLYAYPSKATPFILDVQADIHRHLKSRIVIPLRPYAPKDSPAIQKMCPIVTFKGKKYILFTMEMSALPLSALNKKAGDLKKYEQEIKDSIDFLFQGF